MLSRKVATSQLVNPSRKQSSVKHTEHIKLDHTLLTASKRSTDTSYLVTGNVPKHYENKNNCLLVLRIASVFTILI